MRKIIYSLIVLISLQGKAQAAAGDELPGDFFAAQDVYSRIEMVEKLTVATPSQDQALAELAKSEVVVKVSAEGH